MGKETLKEKIVNVVLIMGLSSLIYFLIGAWLKSDGPNFDPSKTYDLIKDTLSIAASFLAPVAAFVLFSDWREQHVTVKNEKISEDIIKILKIDFKVFYQMLPSELKDSNKYDVNNQLFNHLIATLKGKIEELQTYDNKAKEFEVRVKSIEVDLMSLWGTLTLYTFADRQYETIALHEDSFSIKKREILLEMMEKEASKNQSIYSEIKQKLNDLQPLRV